MGLNLELDFIFRAAVEFRYSMPDMALKVQFVDILTFVYFTVSWEQTKGYF